MDPSSADLDRERERALLERARSGTPAEREAAFTELFVVLQAPILALGQFSIGEQPEAFLEAQLLDLGQGELLAQRFVHTAQAQLLEFIQGGMVQHGGISCGVMEVKVQW